MTYGDNNVVYKKEPEILADNPISDATYQAVTDGMRRVVSSGTASSAFASAKYKAAGKTGTAEVSAVRIMFCLSGLLRMMTRRLLLRLL